ncbi:PaaI family thioesterase [Syntrophomonas wolfei]|uniref:PaaI family thioesterase n=1 Tax=Syntrophomonas wolfei TaxID=863 RepID=UPI0039C94E54
MIFFLYHIPLSSELVVTLNSNISYVRPAKQGKIKAVATAMHRSRQIGSSEVRIYENNALVCFGSYIMFITKKDVAPSVTY